MSVAATYDNVTVLTTEVETEVLYGSFRKTH